MRALKKGDYQVRFDQLKDLLKEKLIGLMIFNEELLRVEQILELHFELRKNNIGTILNPKYELVRILSGYTVKSETESCYAEFRIEFEPGTGVSWVEGKIPNRHTKYIKIKNQIEFMKEKTDESK
jgi:hypothetical protein